MLQVVVSSFPVVVNGEVAPGHLRVGALWAGLLPGPWPKAVGVLELGRSWSWGLHCYILHNAWLGWMAWPVCWKLALWGWLFMWVVIFLGHQLGLPFPTHPWFLPGVVLGLFGPRRDQGIFSAIPRMEGQRLRGGAGGGDCWCQGSSRDIGLGCSPQDTVWDTPARESSPEAPSSWVSLRQVTACPLSSRWPRLAFS